MKNFLGKIIVILTVSCIYSCGTCNDLDINDFEKQIALITRVKKVIINSNTFKASNSLNKHEVKEIIDEKDYEILEKLHFDGIGNVKEVIIFRFKYNDESDALTKKLDKKLELDYQFTCSHFLFYSPDKELRNDISHYERYSECRKDYEDIGNDWTYVKKSFPCGD
jgi:hypothetical protein